MSVLNAVGATQMINCGVVVLRGWIAIVLPTANARACGLVGTDDSFIQPSRRSLGGSDSSSDMHATWDSWGVLLSRDGGGAWIAWSVYPALGTTRGRYPVEHEVSVLSVHHPSISPDHW